MRDYRKVDGKALPRDHKSGRLSYGQSPPVGGVHNAVWQTCQGDVYRAPIANENAVHSLEHGAVWITYRQGLPADQVAVLASKVRGKDYLFLSPVEALDAKVSVQAWGLQLKVASVTDPRIDRFVTQFRRSAAAEPGAPCSGGTTATGTDPKDKP